jgi:hypothetical protein
MSRPTSASEQQCSFVSLTQQRALIHMYEVSGTVRVYVLNVRICNGNMFRVFAFRNSHIPSGTGTVARLRQLMTSLECYPLLRTINNLTPAINSVIHTIHSTTFPLPPPQLLTQGVAYRVGGLYWNLIKLQ